MASNEYHVRITAPNRPEAFAQLMESLDEGDEVVWDGRDEPCTVTEVEMEEASPSGIGRFKKRIIVENQTRSNGGEYRLTYKAGRDPNLSVGPGTGFEPRCRVQRRVGDSGNRNGWGRSSDIESLAHVNPVESMEAEA